jgi:hypothetical protein
MSNEKRNSDHGAARRPTALGLLPEADDAELQDCVARRIATVLAAIDRDLIDRVAKTDELIAHSQASISMIMEMIAFSQEALARSRDLLGDTQARLQHSGTPHRPKTAGK